MLYDAVSPVATLQAFVDLMDGLKQNWAFCYGNHDREQISTSVFQNIIESSDYCIFQSGPDWVMGDSNYCITLTKDGQIKQALVLIDSNSYYEGNSEVYSPIYNSQKLLLQVGIRRPPCSIVCFLPYSNTGVCHTVGKKSGTWRYWNEW
ncbi:MAG: hypothetical protein ACQGQO_07045 [Sphaerochaetaceae bacterium]